MFKVIRKLIYVLAVFLMVFPLVSCGGSEAPVSGGGTTLWITDAPSQNTYQAVFVTIVEIEVNHEVTGRAILAGLDLPQTINLLDWTNGLKFKLGVVDLEPGHYDKMWLRLSTDVSANYVIDSQGATINLKVPSGGQTGIKLNGFDIESSVSTDLILDFDVHNSIHVHPAGKTDKWVLRPTIKVVEIENSVSGTVEAGEDDSGAWVSAQVIDEVVGVAGSLSEGDGTYSMFLPINISGTPYNIVAMKEGFVPECQSLDSTASREYINVNFTLTSAETGTLSGSIVNLPVPGLEDLYSADLSIRQYVDCDGIDGPETLIEVGASKFVNEAGGPISYGPIILTAGEYQVVASADGAGTLSPPFDIVVAAGSDTPLDIDFTPPTP